MKKDRKKTNLSSAEHNLVILCMFFFFFSKEKHGIPNLVIQMIQHLILLNKILSSTINSKLEKIVLGGEFKTF